MDAGQATHTRTRSAGGGSRAWIAIGILAVVGLALLFIPRNIGNTASASKPALLGTILTGQKQAPQFTLRDQMGRSVSLSSFRGKTVVLTFMEARCNQMCPRVADKLHQLSDEVDPGGKKVAILAMTTDPEGDTPAVVKSFSRRHGLSTRWYYLTGSRARLKPLWHAYAIYAAPKASSPAVDAAHTSATYLIDRHGQERVLMGGDLNVSALEWDVRLLSGLPLGAAAHLDPAPEVGHPAPDFALRTLSGATVHLQDLRGKVVLLNFWATYCHPCRSEMPLLSGWYRSLRGKELVVLGIDGQESKDTAAQYAQRLHVPYPIALDGDGSVSSRYDVIGLPTSFLIDRNGIVRSAPPPGVVQAAYLHAHISPLVKAGATQ